MRAARGAGACAALVVTALLIGCGDGGNEDADASGPAAPREFFGVVPQTPLSAPEIERMAAGGVGTVRLVIPWSTLDPTPERGYDFSSVDPLVIEAARNQIEVLPFLYGTPAWVAQGIEGHACEEDCPTFAPRSDAALDAWAAFAGALADRYGPKGSLWAENSEIDPRPVRSWQIWNEQNSATFWQPEPDAAAYAELLERATAEIRERDPEASIVLGGMFGTPPDGDTAWRFLRDLYAIEGPSGSFDAVAVHPYAAQIAKVESQVELIRREVERAGDDDAALWVTEIGWASSGPDVPLNRGPEGQAEQLTLAFEYFLERRTAWNIAGVTWYSWRDTEDTICDWCGGSGLFPVDSLKPKPSWEAFTALTGGE